MMQCVYTVNILGLGYIGIPTAAIIASAGHFVTGTDINEAKVELINNGNIDIVEPGLHDLVTNVVRNKNLVASTHVSESDVFIICVPTPVSKSQEIPDADVSYINAAVKSILLVLKPGDLIILESTSPVGTTHDISKIVSDYGFGKDEIDIAYCPERVLPGTALSELINNDRLIGGINEKSGIRAKSFYQTFVKGNITVTDSKTAELSKLVENSYRDVNIAFANELSIICDEYEIDVFDLIKNCNKHPRVNIAQPGVGVGGHCIPVDPWFIVSQQPSRATLIKTARNINDFKPDFVYDKVIQKISEHQKTFEKAPKVACLGISFKPDIDDFRCSPALQIVNKLSQGIEDLLVVEPNISSLDSLNIVKLDYALQVSDLIIVFVAHKEFRDSFTRNRLIELNSLIFCDLS